jgi:glycosyltransferase involved in cell wall biosynthesis
MEDVVIVVPAYNEGTSIVGVIAGLRQTFRHVVCVDDGSRDRTAELAAEAGAVVVRHGINLGQGAALQTGFDYVLRHTSAAYCVTFDADGQHLVTDAERMVDALRHSDADIALASRFNGDAVDITAGRRALLRGAVLFTRLTTGLRLSDAHNGLRVLRRSALEKIRLTQPGMAHASEFTAEIARGGLSFVEVPATVVYTDYSRSKGQSNVNAVNIVFDLATARLRTRA